jgi:CRP-like cAMP-binding protein
MAQLLREHKSVTRETPNDDDSRALNRQMVAALAHALDFSVYPLKNLAAGHQLAHTGAPVVHLPLLVSGAIDAVVHIGDQGNQVIPISFEAGELAMVSTLFSGKSQPVDLVASQDVVLRWIPVADIELCLQQDHARLVLLVRFLAQRLREVQLRERGWLERGVTERVCITIGRAMLDAPRRLDGRYLLGTTHEHLAARCGVSRSRLSTELKRLEQAGHVALRRGAIEILSPGHFGILA